MCAELRAEPRWEVRALRKGPRRAEELQCSPCLGQEGEAHRGRLGGLQHTHPATAKPRLGRRPHPPFSAHAL